MINIVDVSHHYGIRPVLRNVTLRINKGEVVALMGPNGMGKSTLMGVAAGLLSPLKGYVEIDGKRRRSTPEAEIAIRRQVVYMPAEPWVPSGKTGREWMLAVGRVYQVEEDRLMDHVERLLPLFDLAKQADSLITSYSTGQKKKIAICATLVSEAPVMLLDEPFSGGLDPSALLALKRILKHLASRDDVTILMATPVPELVSELADRVAILREGKILAYDTLPALAAQTGAKSLDEIYENIVNPEHLDSFTRYLEGERR
jgi:ABC-type multidrug transport system ATPase subunit